MIANSFGVPEIQSLDDSTGTVDIRLFPVQPVDALVVIKWVTIGSSIQYENNVDNTFQLENRTSLNEKMGNILLMLQGMILNVYIWLQCNSLSFVYPMLTPSLS